MTELETRKADVMAAKASLLGTVETIRERASPTIVTDAVRIVTRKTVRSVAQDALATAGHRPLAAAGAGLLAALWIFRRPIVKALRNVRRKERNND